MRGAGSLHSDASGPSPVLQTPCPGALRVHGRRRPASRQYALATPKTRSCEVPIAFYQRLLKRTPGSGRSQLSVLGTGCAYPMAARDVSLSWPPRWRGSDTEGRRAAEWWAYQSGRSGAERKHPAPSGAIHNAAPWIVAVGPNRRRRSFGGLISLWIAPTRGVEAAANKKRTEEWPAARKRGIFEYGDSRSHHSCSEVPSDNVLPIRVRTPAPNEATATPQVPPRGQQHSLRGPLALTCSPLVTFAFPPSQASPRPGTKRSHQPRFHPRQGRFLAALRETNPTSPALPRLSGHRRRSLKRLL